MTFVLLKKWQNTTIPWHIRRSDMESNCLTCLYSCVISNGAAVGSALYCDYRYYIPVEVIETGCEYYKLYKYWDTDEVWLLDLESVGLKI
jgi:hypothetical protein